MSNLQNQSPADTYKGLLQVNNYANGVTSAGTYIQDGEGTNSALSISTNNIGIGTTNALTPIHIEEATTSQASIRFEVGTHVFDVGVGGASNPNSDIRDRFYIYDTSNGGDVRLVIDQDGQVGIGTISPSAPLEVSSTTGGLIVPRMTAEQMNAISDPTPGEMVFNTGDGKFYGYDGTNNWVALH